jgi:hypothetical protein
MAAAAAAAKTAAQEVFGGKNQQPSRIEIKIIRLKWLWRINLLPPVEVHDASPADAASVAQMGWHLSQQGIWNLHCHAPTRSFVGGFRAELAMVWLMAQRTSSRIQFF